MLFCQNQHNLVKRVEDFAQSKIDWFFVRFFKFYFYFSTMEALRTIKKKYGPLSPFLEEFLIELNLLNPSAIKALKKPSYLNCDVKDYFLQHIRDFSAHFGYLKCVDPEAYAEKYKDVELRKILKPGDFATLMAISKDKNLLKVKPCVSFSKELMTTK